MAPTYREHEDIPLEKVVTAGSVTGARKAASAGYTTAVNSSTNSDPRPGIGRRKTNGASFTRETEKVEEDGALTRMGRFYLKVLNFSVVTRYFIYVLPLAILLAIPIIIGIFVAPNATVQGVKLKWFFLWLEVGMSPQDSNMYPV